MDLLRRLFGGSATQAERETHPDPVVEATIVDDLDTAPLIERETSAIPTGDTTPAGPLQTRPLDPPKTYKTESPGRRIKYGLASHVGQVRNNNQDGSLVLMVNAEVTGDPPAIGLFAVADGMGGHKDGEHASAVTVQTLAQHVVDQIILPQLEVRQNNSDQKTIPEVLAEALEAAHLAVQLQVPNGGTTATTVVIRGDLAYVAHVGDSRLYLVSDGQMEKVTRDHSLVYRLIELGQLTPEEAEVHPQRNVLYRAIGQGEAIEIDAATRRLPPSSRLVICSDGLWGVIGDQAISDILATYPDPQEACEHLISAANEKGGPDNITAIVVQMPD